MSPTERFFVIALSAFFVVLFGSLAIGLVLVVRDTLRQRGRWGINLKPAVCTQCGAPMPMVRKPANWRQALWGGGTCPECGFELDKWGRPIEDQNSLAKWAILRSAEETEESSRRAKLLEERIRAVNDRTQRGDAS